jgi:hypothetical protein
LLRFGFTVRVSFLSALAHWNRIFRRSGFLNLNGGSRLLCGTVVVALSLSQLAGRAQPVTNHSIFQYAIFYNGLLEFTWNAPFTVNGRTHANGDIFVGSSQNLTFGAPVTAAGAIYKTNWAGHPLNSMTGSIFFSTNVPAGSPGYSTSVAPLHLPVGTNQSAAVYREIVEIPPPAEDPSSPLAQMRYYNKAGVVVLVSNASITVSVKTSIADTPTNLVEFFAPTNISGTNRYTSTNLPWLTLSSNSFVEFRENQKKVKLTDIDVSVLKNWLPTNALILSKFPPGSDLLPNIFYVADLRDQASWELAAVRVKNGAIIATNATPDGAPTGWTLATPNPLYIAGHYNIGPGGTPGSNNTTKTYPAALISDAVTILSSSWNDKTYTNSNLFSRNATSTTVNAALLTGIVYSTATDWTDTNHFSGGMQNVPRLLENLVGDVLTLNTSLVNLYPSARATNFFKNPGVYYNAPTRLFSFDQNFNDPTKLPPGTPICGSPPSFTAQPSDQVALASTTVTFTANAVCSLPLRYQWHFNGTNVPGATDNLLTLTNLQPTQAGQYGVEVDGAYGSSFSSNALLTVSYAATLSDFSLSAEGFPQFSVSGVPSLTYAIQTSTNLTDWELLFTNAAPFVFSDTNPLPAARRFYRAVYAP